MDNKGNEQQNLTVAISGASGFIGTSLVRALIEKGYFVIKLVRHKKTKEGEVYWDPALNYIDPSKLENVDVVINLCGKSIAEKRWTPKVKNELKESRIKSTQLLAGTLGRLKNPPKLFLSASAMGYYGNRGDEIIDESMQPGSGFLAQMTREWELSTWAAEAIGIRVNHLRIGMVLGHTGGALARMISPFRMGLGAILGDGNQYMSWISERDLIRSVIFLIENPQPTGPFNLVGPNPVSHKTFMKTLAGVLRRPLWIRLSDKMVKFIFGEMGESLFLDSARIQPKKLSEAGFEFLDKELKPTLQNILKK